MEVNIDEIYKPGTVLDIPKRQSWDYSLKKEELEAKEENYFKVCIQYCTPFEIFELREATFVSGWQLQRMQNS